jgi:hypothetical protein
VIWWSTISYIDRFRRVRAPLSRCALKCPSRCPCVFAKQREAVSRVVRAPRALRGQALARGGLTVRCGRAGRRRRRKAAPLASGIVDGRISCLPVWPVAAYIGVFACATQAARTRRCRPATVSGARCGTRASAVPSRATGKRQAPAASVATQAAHPLPPWRAAQPQRGRRPAASTSAHQAWCTRSPVAPVVTPGHNGDTASTACQRATRSNAPRPPRGSTPVGLALQPPPTRRLRCSRGGRGQWRAPNSRLGDACGPPCPSSLSDDDGEAQAASRTLGTGADTMRTAPQPCARATAPSESKLVKTWMRA